MRLRPFGGKRDRKRECSNEKQQAVPFRSPAGDREAVDALYQLRIISGKDDGGTETLHRCDGSVVRVFQAHGWSWGGLPRSGHRLSRLYSLLLYWKISPDK